MAKKVTEWLRIPDGSVLRVQVDLGTGSIDGFFAESDGDGRPLSRNELKQGVEFTLRKPEGYSVALVIRYAKQSSFTVRGRVVKPGGKVHGTPYEEELSAPAGHVKIVGFLAKTEQS